MAIMVLAPSPACAQWANSIGIYTTSAATSSEIINPQIGDQYWIYFVLNDPRAANGAPVAAINGFEFRVSTAGPAEEVLGLQMVLPPGHINLGDNGEYLNSNYIVGARYPMPVTNRRVTLMSMKILIWARSSPTYLYLGPTFPASVPDHLGFVYWSATGDGILRGATGTQPLFTLPEFAIGARLVPPVPAESVSFGAVKALYR